MNNYARLPHVRVAIAGAGATSTDDATIIRMVGAASREIEGHCLGRKFYNEVATRTFDGDGTRQLLLPVGTDLLNVTSVKVDTDGDGAFETTLTTDDYRLRPLGRAQKAIVELKRTGSLAAFPCIEESIQILGTWGTAVQSDVSGLTGSLSDASDTLLTASADASAIIYAGDTLLIEDEQVYVTAVVTTTVTVVRGVNGTTAAAHTTQPLLIRRYPEDIEAACMVRTADLFRGAQTGFMAQVGGPEFGGFASNTAWLQFIGLLRNGHIPEAGVVFA